MAVVELDLLRRIPVNNGPLQPASKRHQDVTLPRVYVIRLKPNAIVNRPLLKAKGPQERSACPAGGHNGTWEPANPYAHARRRVAGPQVYFYIDVKDEIFLAE